MAPTITEIMAIGNELLIGDVLDTNTRWLCQRITGLGGRVMRSTMIRDDPATIAEVLHGAIGRGAQVVFTTGGLGPTADDLTLAAIGEALGRPVQEDPQALEMIQGAYGRLAREGYVDDDEMTDARRKMARLPADSEPLFNPVGTAPGVLMHEGASTIVCLPGVPEELKGIFEQSLASHLADLYGEGYYTERMVRVECADESVLVPVVSRVAGRYSEVYVKSRAKPAGPNVRLMITLSARGESRQEVDALLQRAVDELQAGLEEQGIPVIEVS